MTVHFEIKHLVHCYHLQVVLVIIIVNLLMVVLNAFLVGIAVDGGNDINNNGGKSEIALCKRKGKVAELEVEVAGMSVKCLIR